MGLYEPVRLGLDALRAAIRRRGNLRRVFTVSIRLLRERGLVVGCRALAVGLGRLSLFRSVGAVSLPLVSRAVSGGLRLGTLSRRRLAARRIPRNQPYHPRIPRPQ